LIDFQTGNPLAAAPLEARNLEARNLEARNLEVQNLEVLSQDMSDSSWNLPVELPELRQERQEPLEAMMPYEFEMIEELPFPADLVFRS